MMRHRAALAVAPAALAIVTLTGCQGSGAASAAGAASSSSSPARPAASSSAWMPGSASAPGPPRCQPSGLTAALRTRQLSTGDEYVRIVFTNTSSSACYMYGYPGVDLIGHGITWPLERQIATSARVPRQPARVLLQPGGTAQSRLTGSQ